MRLLDLCLLLAVAYPLLAILLNWAMTGEARQIGALEVLPPQPDHWRRLMAAGLIAASVCALAFSRRGAGPFGVIWAFAAVAGAVAVAGAFAGTFAVAFTVAVAVSGAFVLTEVAVAGSFAVALAVALAVAGAVAGAVAVAVAVAGAFAGAVAQNWLGQKFEARRPALLIFSILLFVAIAAVGFTRESLGADARIMFLFLGFFPLLNAWADFASVGLTRWRLRFGVQGQLVFNAALDAVAAVATLLLLAIAMIATAHIVRPGGAPLVDLPALFAGLRETPRDYWWLGFMLLSTLLPTLAHLAIGAFALFTLVSGWLGRPIAAGLMKGDSPEGRAASLALTLAAAFALWLPLFLLWHALTLGGGWLLAGLIAACEGFHGLLTARFPVA